MLKKVSTDYQGWDPSSIFNGGGNDDDVELESKAHLIHPVSYASNKRNEPSWVGDDDVESKGTLDDTIANTSQSTSRRYSNPPNEENDESTNNNRDPRAYDRFVLPFPRPDDNLSLSLSEPIFTEGPPGSFLHPTTTVSDPPQQDPPEERVTDDESVAPEVTLSPTPLLDQNNHEQDLGNNHLNNTGNDDLLNTTATKTPTKATTVDHNDTVEREITTTVIPQQQEDADTLIVETDSCKALDNDNDSTRIKEDFSENNAIDDLAVPLTSVIENSSKTVSTAASTPTATTAAEVAIPTVTPTKDDHKETEGRSDLSTSSLPSSPSLVAKSNEDLKPLDDVAVAAVVSTPPVTPSVVTASPAIDPAIATATARGTTPRSTEREGEGLVEGPADRSKETRHPSQELGEGEASVLPTITPPSPTPSTSSSQPSTSHSIPPSSLSIPSSSSPSSSSSKQAIEATTVVDSTVTPQSLLLSSPSSNINNNNNNNNTSSNDNNNNTTPDNSNNNNSNSNSSTKKPPPPPPPKGSPTARVMTPGQGLRPAPRPTLPLDRSAANANPSNIKIPSQPPKPGEGRRALGMMEEPCMAIL